MQQQLEKNEEEQHATQMPLTEVALEEEIVCGMRAKPFKEGLLPQILAITIFIPIVLLFANIGDLRKVSPFINPAFIVIYIFGILFVVLDWYYRWIRVDKEGIHWRNIFRKKQFARWEDISDYYLEIPKIVQVISTHIMPAKSVVIFRDGRKLSLLPEFGVLTPTTKLHQRIMEKASNAPAQSWEMEGIRSQEDWEYTYSISDKNPAKKIAYIVSGIVLIAIMPITMFQMIVNKNIPADKNLFFIIFFSVMAMFMVGICILGHYADIFLRYFKLKAFRKIQIKVNREGVSWINAEGSGSAKWEQVIALRREGGITSEKVCYVVSLAGNEETEIRFPGNTIFRDYMHPAKKRIPLETAIQMYGIGTKNKTIEQTEDMLNTAIPQSAYPIAGAKIYSYNTIGMRDAKKKLTPIMFVFPIILFILFRPTNRILPIEFIYNSFCLYIFSIANI
jgi:hypothetical protein